MPSYKNLTIPAEGTYYLEIGKVTNEPFVSVCLNDEFSEPFFIPASAKTIYQLRVHEPDTTLLFVDDEVEIKLFRRWSFFDFPKLMRRRRQREDLRIDCHPRLTIFPLFHLCGSDALEYAKGIRALTIWGFGVNTANFQNTLVYDKARQKMRAHTSVSEAESPLSIGIVAHIHYTDTWPDFAKRLERLSTPFKLIVTLTATDSGFIATIKDQFPDALILTYPNRGRDIGPFIQLWRDGHLNSFDLICKVHGKKSAASGWRFYLGEIWRKALLNDLIGSDAVVRAIVSRFAQNVRVGMLGSRRFRFPNPHMPTEEAWTGNKVLTYQVVQSLGLSSQDFKLDYFAGTMFWMRRELLDLLKPLHLSQQSFPEESGQSDGTLHHAFERLFGALPAAAPSKMVLVDTIWEEIDRDIDAWPVT